MGDGDFVMSCILGAAGTYMVIVFMAWVRGEVVKARERNQVMSCSLDAQNDKVDRLRRRLDETAAALESVVKHQQGEKVMRCNDCGAEFDVGSAGGGSAALGMCFKCLSGVSSPLPAHGTYRVLVLLGHTMNPNLEWTRTPEGALVSSLQTVPVYHEYRYGKASIITAETPDAADILARSKSGRVIFVKNKKKEKDMPSQLFAGFAGKVEVNPPSRLIQDRVESLEKDLLAAGKGLKELTLYLNGEVKGTKSYPKVCSDQQTQEVAINNILDRLRKLEQQGKAHLESNAADFKGLAEQWAATVKNVQDLQKNWHDLITGTIKLTEFCHHDGSKSFWASPDGTAFSSYSSMSASLDQYRNLMGLPKEDTPKGRGDAGGTVTLWDRVRKEEKKFEDLASTMTGHITRLEGMIRDLIDNTARLSYVTQLDKRVERLEHLDKTDGRREREKSQLALENTSLLSTRVSYLEQYRDDTQGDVKYETRRRRFWMAVLAIIGGSLLYAHVSDTIRLQKSHDEMAAQVREMKFQAQVKVGE